MRTRWAILGLGAISRDFVAALHASKYGVLHAAGSSAPERAERFATENGVDIFGTYDDVLARDDIDAVYISTVHTTHAELTIRALEAGKAVLCEKPAALTLDEVERMLVTAARVGLPFVEAHKTRFSPFADTLNALVAREAGAGERRLTATRGGASVSRDGRLFDPAVGGGSILDIGCYPVGLAVQIAAAMGELLGDITFGDVSAELVAGVDATAAARFSLGRLDVSVGSSIVKTLPSTSTIDIGDCQVVLPDPWGNRVESPSAILVRRGGREETLTIPTVQPMAAEADALSVAMAENQLEWPQMPWAQTRAIAAVVEIWRERALSVGAERP